MSDDEDANAYEFVTDKENLLPVDHQASSVRSV